MKIRLRKYIGMFLLLFIAGSLLTAKSSQAASAEVTISTDATKVTKGDQVYVYINIESAAEFRDVEASFVYNEDVFKYTGSASMISGGNGLLKISDIGVLESNTSRKYALEFEAIDVGTSEFSFLKQVNVYDEDENAMSVSSNKLSLKVEAKATASTNNSLKSLITSPSPLEPVFDKNVLEYKVNVGYETENLIISAIPEDDKAKVSISGNDFLEEGENKVIVTVLAESGDDIEYIINVNRDKAPEDGTKEEDDTDPSDELNGSFEVIQIDGIKYAVLGGKYKLVEPISEAMIPEGYIKTQLIISDLSFTALSPMDNLDSDFLLLYAMNEAGETGLYRYDRIERTLQRYFEEETSLNDTVTSDYAEKNKQYRANLNTAAVVIALLCVVCAALTFVIFRLVLKLKRYKEEDLD